ncbi:MAG: hypothetical protein AAF449_17365 [Myxococcota bacterium]
MSASLHRLIFPGLSALAIAIASFVVTSCTDECQRASDCLRGEVCYIGACEPASLSQAACQSSADCNQGSSNNLQCIGGRCVIDPTVVSPTCTIRPVCFDRGNAVPITPSTLTATVGTVLADQGVAMVDVLAITTAGSSLFRVVGRTADSTRYFCATIDSSDDSCELVQIALGDPANAATTFYQTSACSTTIERAMGGRLIGSVTGDVVNCAGNQFPAGADFDIPYQN